MNSLANCLRRIEPTGARTSTYRKRSLLHSINTCKISSNDSRQISRSSSWRTRHWWQWSSTRWKNCQCGAKKCRTMKSIFNGHHRICSTRCNQAYRCKPYSSKASITLYSLQFKSLYRMAKNHQSLRTLSVSTATWKLSISPRRNRSVK